MNLLYLSDVFCPWCYGFGPVMRRILADYPGTSVRVLGGDLVDEALTLSEMKEEHPSIREFFARLETTTGQSAGAFLKILEDAGSGGPDWRMYSPETGLPLAVLKTLAPGHELEQMQAFQHAFYAEGRDVLDISVQLDIASRWGVEAAVFEAARADPAVRVRAEKEAAEASDIMGEFRLYPTLYLEGEGGRELLARGYAPYETVRAGLEAALSGRDGGFAEGAACGLDGRCCGQA